MASFDGYCFRDGNGKFWPETFISVAKLEEGKRFMARVACWDCVIGTPRGVQVSEFDDENRRDYLYQLACASGGQPVAVVFEEVECPDD